MPDNQDRSSNGDRVRGTYAGDPYIDVPLWDNDYGVCVECGALTEDAGAKRCDRCSE